MKRSKNIFMAIVSTILIFALSVPTFAGVKKINLYTDLNSVRPTFYKNRVDVYFHADAFADKLAIEISPDVSFPAENTVVLKIRGTKVLDYEHNLETKKGKLLGYFKCYDLETAHSSHILRSCEYFNGRKEIEYELTWFETKKRMESEGEMGSVLTKDGKEGTLCQVIYQARDNYQKNQDLYVRVKLYLGSKLVARSPKTKVIYSKRYTEPYPSIPD